MATVVFLMMLKIMVTQTQYSMANSMIMQIILVIYVFFFSVSKGRSSPENRQKGRLLRELGGG